MEIKTIDVKAMEWFDKVNGNSYHATQVILNYGMRDDCYITVPLQHGFGESYLQTALEALKERNLVPAKYSALWRFCDDNDIILRYDKHENCLKRDAKAFGGE